MKIEIKGRIPSLKNSKQVFCLINKKTGKARPVVTSSVKHKEWHNDAMQQLKDQNVPKTKAKMVEVIALTFYAPDKRKADLTNKTESIMDLLVDYGLLEDDNWYVCPDIQLAFGGVDRENPRCEITLPE